MTKLCRERSITRDVEDGRDCCGTGRQDTLSVAQTSAKANLRIGKVVAWLGIDHKNWSRYGIGPFWVIFHNTEWGRSPLVLEALKSWAPPRLFEQDDRALIPLTVLPNVAREIVLEDLLKELKQLHDGLQPAAPISTTTQV